MFCCKIGSLKERGSMKSNSAFSSCFRVLIALIGMWAAAEQSFAAVSVTAASGGGSISADRARNAVSPAWTSLGGITIAETGSNRGDIGGGTLVFRAPAGFEFNLAQTPGVSFTAGRNITNATVAVTDSNTVTVTLQVSGTTSTDSLTITNIQVRPVVGTPLASGTLHRPLTGGGTAVIVGVTATDNPSGSGGTSFGSLGMVAGAASRLGLQAQPPSTTVYGAVLSPAPVVQIQDQFGNLRTTDNSSVVAARIGLGGTVLAGNSNVTASAGVATFSNLSLKTAGLTRLLFTNTVAASTNSQDISVTPATLTVTADNKNRTYGATNPVFTVSYTGFAAGETLATSGVTGSPVLSTSAGTNSSPAGYAINITTGTLAAVNYTFALVPGQLTVTKTPLIVAADNNWKKVGTANPALTYSISGFVNGETAAVLSGAPTLSTTATTSSPVGNYPITVALGTLASANYSFTSVNGTLSVVPADTLFYDGFTRPTEPGVLDPWKVQAGVWTVTGGVLQGGTNLIRSYGFAYLTNSWTNYTAEGRFRWSPGAYGGGLGARLNTASGAHYAAWVYPESAGGSSNLIRLIKFQNWTSYGYDNVVGAVMGQASLSSVGTNWHALKLVVNGNALSVYFDGLRALTAVDIEAQPLLQGGVTADLWTDSVGYQMSVDDLRVAAWSGPVATNDTYATTLGSVLTVATPGVLVNDLAAGTNISAVLVTTTTNGTLSLASNGSFVYTPTGSGTDRFTYRVNDGTANSGNATVTINITANTPPTASADSYSVPQNTLLTVPAPGVLGNDADPNPQTLTAVLVTPPATGTLSLSTNGAFTYVPRYGYTGNATFVYRANDGLANSANATVTLAVTSQATLLSDNFTRTNDPGTLAPWVVRSGTWTVTGGLMQGGTNSPSSYGFVYTTNQWTDYSVDARVQLPAGAYGGGLGARLDPVSGRHYAAWLYPETSPGGSNLVRLLKFQSWGAFGYSNVAGAPMRQVSVPAVGTNWHTLKLLCYDGRLAVYYDGRQIINMVDTEPQAYTSGGTALEFWTDATPYRPNFDNVLAVPWTGPVASNDVYYVAVNTPITVAAPGVLINDLAAGTNLVVTGLSTPTKGNFTLSTNGGFTYTPTNSFVGTDTFTYRVNDGLANSGTATVTLNVATNASPIAANDSYAGIQGLALTVPAPGVLANDSDPHGQPLIAVVATQPASGSCEPEHQRRLYLYAGLGLFRGGLVHLPCE